MNCDGDESEIKVEKRFMNNVKLFFSLVIINLPVKGLLKV